MSSTRLPIVGVMGSGRHAHTERAEALGAWLARAGVHLLTGGGAGVMASVSRAFSGVAGRRGLVIGIIPAAPEGMGPKPGYPNPWVEIPVFTHLPLSGNRGCDMLSRNHINVLTADVIIALPGSAGTASEVALALRYERPVVAYLDRREQIAGLPQEVPVENRIEAVCEFISRHLRPS